MDGTLPPVTPHIPLPPCYTLDELREAYLVGWSAGHRWYTRPPANMLDLTKPFQEWLDNRK